MTIPPLVIAVAVIVLLAVLIGSPGIGLWGGGPMR